jgi:molybdopterin synthase sulfur carrier subunit
MPTVWIPALLRPLTRQQESVQVSGATLAEVIDALDRQFPGVKDRLCQGGELRPGLAVVVDTQVIRTGLSQAVDEKSEVHFVPAIAGGANEER